MDPIKFLLESLEENMPYKDFPIRNCKHSFYPCIAEPVHSEEQEREWRMRIGHPPKRKFGHWSTEDGTKTLASLNVPVEEK